MLYDDDFELYDNLHFTNPMIHCPKKALLDCESLYSQYFSPDFNKKSNDFLSQNNICNKSRKEMNGRSEIKDLTIFSKVSLLESPNLMNPHKKSDHFSFEKSSNNSFSRDFNAQNALYESNPSDKALFTDLLVFN